MHTCPMVTGVVPHVGGPILPPCHATTLIGGLPAARIGDMLTCVGPPDVIVKGSPTVLIGMMPAARMGDNTAHGGVIVLGHPTTMIGDSGSGGGGGGGAGGAPGGGADGTQQPSDSQAAQSGSPAPTAAPIAVTPLEVQAGMAANSGHPLCEVCPEEPAQQAPGQTPEATEDTAAAEASGTGAEREEDDSAPPSSAPGTSAQADE